MLAIPPLRQEGHSFEVSLGYMVRLSEFTFLNPKIIKEVRKFYK
jgi:hypothetical protein